MKPILKDEADEHLIRRLIQADSKLSRLYTRLLSTIILPKSAYTHHGASSSLPSEGLHQSPHDAPWVGLPMPNCLTIVTSIERRHGSGALHSLISFMKMGLACGFKPFRRFRGLSHGHGSSIPTHTLSAKIPSGISKFGEKSLHNCHALGCLAGSGSMALDRIRINL